MKERPIIFSSEMVQAILEGRKTQTRREGGFDKKINKIPLENRNQCKFMGFVGGNPLYAAFITPFTDIPSLVVKCPYGKVGDRLWVRETWNFISDSQDGMGDRCYYLSDMLKFPDSVQESNTAFMKKWGYSWKSPMFMPRKYSRITLEITNIRVERLNDISQEDCLSEGIELDYSKCEYTRFQQLWESLKGKGSWQLNPFVWVIEFKRIEE